MPEVHDIELRGCAPEPLMAYLKALGVLRLVAEQKDSAARGWWKDDAFFLRSKLDGDALVKFHLEDYRPTPIVAPWAGGSGFFDKDNKRAVDAIAKSADTRLADYRSVIDSVRAILEKEGVTSKPSDEMKARLLQRYRRELPLRVVDWMDAAMVLRESRQEFAPVLGTGGNDGRLDFTQNFMGRLVTLGIAGGQVNKLSEEWLLNALFAAPARQLESAAVGQFAPGRAGGANATQGMEGDATDNPWDFVLMLEGTLGLAGAVVRRLGASDTSRASFPFTVRPAAAGYHSAADEDEVQSRGEIWLPLWDRPATVTELRTLFAEGRADASGRRARYGLDFARAVATLGVDRGIKLFSRYSFLRRSGKAYLASPLGRFEVRERHEVDLLREIDPWLDRFRQAAGNKKAPARFRSALHRINQAIFDLCRYGGTIHLQSVLIDLGRAERELALTAGRVGQGKTIVPPAFGLSAEWGTESDDGSHEFTIARALAWIDDNDRKIGSLRPNLEPVRVWHESGEGRQQAAWAEKDRAVVWNTADLSTNLAAVLVRRMMDGDREGCADLPLWSAATAPLSSIAKFIARETDDRRIEDLVWGLVLVSPDKYNPPKSEDDTEIPAAYALLKLLFLSRPLVIERDAGGRVSHARLLRPDIATQRGVRIRPEPRILHLLRTRRLGEALGIGMRRLRASGLAPMPRARAGRARDRDWEELDRMGTAGLDPLRVAAALLIPITDRAVSRLIGLVTRPENIETELERAGSTTAGG
jgi:CRISPR-associated protein Csx17